MRVLAFSGGKDSMACLHLMRDTLNFAIYADTGKTFPETQAMVEYASMLLPVIVVTTDRDKQNEEEGIPTDVIPVNWTKLGQMMTGPKPVMVQSYTMCCYTNIAYPIIQKAHELQADEIVYGQRNSDRHRATSRDGDMIDGMVRLHPIEDWTRVQVLEYLETKMDVPPHYYHIEHSSLDCYDCPAYESDTKDLVAFTKRRYPEFYEQYLKRSKMVDDALMQSIKGKWI